MDQLIAVVDLSSGIVSNRKTETLTLDVPSGFNRNNGRRGVSVDADKLGRYLTLEGKSRVYATAPKYLSRRLPGEECMVATPEVDSTGTACKRHYWLSLVEPRV